MSVTDLEVELARWRGRNNAGETNTRRLTTEEALAIRAAGNVPDELGRSLRLVLEVVPNESLEERRLRWEPDFHDPPKWRGPGSVPVNVIPLKNPESSSRGPDAWWQDDEMSRMEAEWSHSGAVAGLRVPAAYRGFVFKTIASLQRAGRPVNVETVVGSVARWLDPTHVSELRAALEEANG